MNQPFERRVIEGRVHVRTPAYRRPELLRRALQSLQSQTWSDWVCDVFDDDPQRSGAAVCSALNDERIRYYANAPQRFASRNIDACFDRSNPHGAEFFFVLEDDNYVFDTFIAENIALSRHESVELILRNQVIDYDLTGRGREVSSFGILERTYREGRQAASDIRLGALSGIGVSNGALFWSVRAKSDLEIGIPCNASLQEYLRTLAISDDTYVALTPLAAWASNGEATTRNLGDKAGYLKRELALKRAIQRVRRRIWETTDRLDRRELLAGRKLQASPETIAENFDKALILTATPGARRPVHRVNAILRGLLILIAGRIEPGLEVYIASKPDVSTVSRAPSSTDGPPLR